MLGCLVFDWGLGRKRNEPGDDAGLVAWEDVMGVTDRVIRQNMIPNFGLHAPPFFAIRHFILKSVVSAG